MLTNTRPRVILLADDDPEDQEMLEEALLAADPRLQLTMVGNGRQAVEYLENLPDEALPDFIVLDYKMPVYNAVEVLEKIRVQPRLNAIPKVVWSTSNQPEHVRSCLEKGALEYFVKPAQLSELKEITRRMLRLCDASAGPQ
ncbi:MAG: response regulator [Chitinophaga sp.]